MESNRSREILELIALSCIVFCLVIFLLFFYWFPFAIDPSLKISLDVFLLLVLFLSLVVLFDLKLNPSKVELISGVVVLLANVISVVFSMNHYPYHKPLSLFTTLLLVFFGVYMFRKKKRS